MGDLAAADSANATIDDRGIRNANPKEVGEADKSGNLKEARRCRGKHKKRMLCELDGANRGGGKQMGAKGWFENNVALSTFFGD